MQQGMNQPLRIIIQRFIGCDSNDVEDTIEIIQFLITYAENLPGSEHLMKENILQYLMMNQSIKNSKL